MYVYASILYGRGVADRVVWLLYVNSRPEYATWWSITEVLHLALKLSTPSYAGFRVLIVIMAKNRLTLRPYFLLLAWIIKGCSSL